MGIEKNIENGIKDHLTQCRLAGHRIFFYKAFQTSGSVPGIPDIIACVEGYFVGIEIKTPVGELRDVQKVIAKNIADANGVFVVCDDVDRFIAWFNRFLYNPAEYCGRKLSIRLVDRKERP